MELLRRLKIVFSIDLRTLALFRVCLGSVLLLDLFLRSFDLLQFYTDDGVLGRANWVKATNHLHWSLHAASGQAWFQILLFVVAAICASLLIVGYRTRIMAFCCWVLTASLINRNGYILQGGDELLVILTFWAMFLPIHARYSVDAALSRSYEHDANEPRLDNTFFSVATVAVILQVLYLYFFTALLKTGPHWRVDMNAAFYAVSLQHFATPIGAFMRNFPAFLTFGTWCVMVIEFVGPFLALSPWFHLPLRLVALVCLYGLHVAFLLMLHIGLFPLIDFTALSLLIPGAIWAWLGNWRDRKPANTARIKGINRSKIRIHFDEDCGFCRKTVLILREFLLPSSAQILPAQQDPEILAVLQEQNSWVVTDHNGYVYTRWKAMQFLFGQSPLFKPIGWLMKLPFLMRFGEWVYGKVALNRNTLSRWSQRTLPYREIKIQPRLLTQGLAAFFLYVVTFVNIAGIRELNIEKPNHVLQTQRIFRIDQRWDMFAPFPLTYSLYPVVVGNLRDGTQVDLMKRNMDPPDFKVPDYTYPVFESYRWRKFLGRVNSFKTNTIRQGYGSYLCRYWNHPDRAENQQLATIDVNFVRLDTNTTGSPKTKSQRRAWQHWCYAEFAPSPDK